MCKMGVEEFLKKEFPEQDEVLLASYFERINFDPLYATFHTDH